MSYGAEFFNDNGTVALTAQGTTGKIIAIGLISFAEAQYGTKSITLSGLISSDVIIVQNVNNPNVIYSGSRSGTTFSLNRTNALAGDPSSHFIMAVRY